MKLKTLLVATGLAFTLSTAAVQAADDAAKLSDVEYAHVAYTADNADIRYAHLALAISTNPDIHAFARTMIRDHEAVNEQALALLKKLGAKPKNNFLSKFIAKRSDKLVDEMSKLRGKAFDKRYAQNELYQRPKLMTGMCPVSHCDGCDCLRLCDKFVPSFAPGVEDRFIVFEDAV